MFFYGQSIVIALVKVQVLVLCLSINIKININNNGNHSNGNGSNTVSGFVFSTKRNTKSCASSTTTLNASTTTSSSTSRLISQTQSQDVMTDRLLKKIDVFLDSNLQRQTKTRTNPNIATTTATTTNDTTNYNNNNLISVQNDMLHKIETRYRSDIEFCSKFASEGINSNANNDNDEMRIQIPSFEYIQKQQQNQQQKQQQQQSSSSSFLAIRTIDKENPILDQDSISTIIKAAEYTWFPTDDDDDDDDDEQQQETIKSRFTYQRKGNYEAHIIDLANDVNDNIHSIMNTALMNRIYPLVRNVFCDDIQLTGDDINTIDFCVYDSLIIRYNSTEALMNSMDMSMDMDIDMDMSMKNDDSNQKKFLGAGQPLHRDLGLVSVNIMLNSDDEFEGGGTFFEQMMEGPMKKKLKHDHNQVLVEEKQQQQQLQPLKPTGTGQAVVHLSSKRHAGAGTTDGVRDILVIFLTAKKLGEREENDELSNNNNINTNINTDKIWIGPPNMEKAARLKVQARDYALNKEYDTNNDSDKQATASTTSIIYRMIAHRLAITNVPIDGEAWHYLGMAIQEYALLVLSSSAREHEHEHENHYLDNPKELIDMSISCLKHALVLTPCDGRLCNNLGLAHETLYKFRPDSGRNTSSSSTVTFYQDDDFIPHTKEQQDEITNYYQQSQLLHSMAEDVGCDVRLDSDMACLNHGLYLSRQDRYIDAANVLCRFENIDLDSLLSSTTTTMKNDNDLQHKKIKYDGSRLFQFCASRAAQ